MWRTRQAVFRGTNNLRPRVEQLEDALEEERERGDRLEAEIEQQQNRSIQQQCCIIEVHRLLDQERDRITQLENRADRAERALEEQRAHVNQVDLALRTRLRAQQRQFRDLVRVVYDIHPQMPQFENTSQAHTSQAHRGSSVSRDGSHHTYVDDRAGHRDRERADDSGGEGNAHNRGRR